jgi:beta-RFAP synthase
MAVGLALSSWFRLAICNADQLSTIMERGLRSAIGTHGFLRGGFLVDRGKRTGDELASLGLHFDFPESWPILVLTLRAAGGIHGPEEIEAFKRIPQSTVEHRDRMIEMVKNQIAPAIATTNYDQLGDALFEYGRSSGSAYKSVQGGDFHSPPIEKLVYRVRDLGVPAVGQSSWGPCVFAIIRDNETADSLAEKLNAEYGDTLNIKKTFALNQGAEIKWLD